jgi:hypothetical protein
MRTIEIPVYRFNELKRAAQDEAIAEERHDLIIDLDYVLDDWKEKLKNLGYGKVDIWYSGFGNQGDGVSFTSEGNIVEAKGIREIVEGVCSSTGSSGWTDLYIAIKRGDSRYCHENTISIEAESLTILPSYLAEIEERAEAVVRGLCREIYQDLETAYDAATSDAAIIELIAAGEYEFYENGHRYIDNEVMGY